MTRDKVEIHRLPNGQLRVIAWNDQGNTLADYTFGCDPQTFRFRLARDYARSLATRHNICFDTTVKEIANAT